MQYNAEWQQQQALPLTVHKGRVHYSPFSIAMRILLFVWLAYWVLTNFIL